jgi:hypothetical protein
VHDVLKPVPEAYLPLGHGMHAAAPPVLYESTPHWIAVLVLDPGGHAYPAAHGPLHAADPSPGAAPKVPAGHCVQKDALAVL